MRFLSLIAVAGVLSTSAVPAAARGNDRSWVALHIWDGMFPLNGEQVFPESLMALEIGNQLYERRNVIRDLGRLFGVKGDRYGSRSNLGHYMLWIHLSDEVLARHPRLRQEMGNLYFMFPDRETDIFSAWGGDVNLVALVTKGMQGLAEPAIDDATGRLTGSFQGFGGALRQGEADWEGGWYMSTEQAERILTAFRTYPGIEKGYAFMSKISERPNAPYEPAAAQLTNGYNCGDFAYYALSTAGVLSKDAAESLKIQFWYPVHSYDHPLPLDGAGKKIAKWISKHPGARTVPRGKLLGMVALPLLFGRYGLEFFDEEALVLDVQQHWRPHVPARIWDHVGAYTKLESMVDFRSKGVRSELAGYVKSGRAIASPYPDIGKAERDWHRYRISDPFRRIEGRGREFHRRKLKKAGLEGEALDEFRALQENLKIH